MPTLSPFQLLGLGLVALAVLVPVIAFNVRRLRAARAAMVQAVASQGLSLIDARLCWVPTGPFATAIATHQPVYRVRVRDARGEMQRGWVRCEPGSQTVEVIWEGSVRPAPPRP